MMSSALLNHCCYFFKGGNQGYCFLVIIFTSKFKIQIGRGGGGGGGGGQYYSFRNINKSRLTEFGDAQFFFAYLTNFKI